jgi:hypothetical protein
MDAVNGATAGSRQRESYNSTHNALAIGKEQRGTLRALKWSLKSLTDRGMVDELIDDVDETIDSTANTVAIHIGR